MTDTILDLLAIGDCSIDLYMKIDEGAAGVVGGTPESPQICFFHGSKIKASQCQSFVAGNACNVSVGAKTLGLRVGIYTELGGDDNAKRFLKEFKDLGIDTTLCKINADSPTNVHTVLIYGQERTIITYHEKRTYKLPTFAAPKWLYYTSISQGFEPFQKELVRYLKDNTKIGVAFNPGTIQLESGLTGIGDFLAVTDILFLNKEEAIRLVGDYAIDRLHVKLQTYGPKLTVITDGKNGSTALEGKNFFEQTCLPIPKILVDKTGAGDAYASGFLSAIFYGRSVREALLWGSLNSANVITKMGAVNGLLDKKHIEKEIKVRDVKYKPSK